jgi:hypothetical protein
MGVIDLNGWHHALHQVTGAMALRWCRATHGDLAKWAQELRAVADAMAQAADGAEPTAIIATADNTVPDWLLEATASEPA